MDMKKAVLVALGKALTMEKAMAMLSGGLPKDQVKTAMGVLSFFGIVNFVPAEGKEKTDMLTKMIEAATAAIGTATIAIRQAPENFEALKARIKAATEQRQAAIQRVADKRKKIVANAGAEITAKVVTEHWSRLEALENKLCSANVQLTIANAHLAEAQEVVRLFS